LSTQTQILGRIYAQTPAIKYPVMYQCTCLPVLMW